MRTIVIGSTKHLLMAIFYASLGIFVALLVAGVWFLNARPDLDIWHTVDLESDFKRTKGLETFSDYLDLEKVLFKEVEEKIYDQTLTPHPSILNRYVRGSLADPQKWRHDWNRSYEWPNEDADFGVLLLHGMSDSPYALSHVAKHFEDKAYVLGLRLPGHGTIPSGLVDIQWQDMAAAVSLATEHLKRVLNGKPLYVIGFSTGAALALNHELERLAKNKTGEYSGMVFLSPAIGLPPVAAGAQWQSKLGALLGLEKLSWNSIQTEYDPFKYNSFAVNAGDVVYQLAERNQLLLDQASRQQLESLSSVLAFQSLTDDTVSTQAVISGLFQKLPQDNHQLVIFDINRTEVNMGLIPDDPILHFGGLFNTTHLKYDLTLVHNNFDTLDLPRDVVAETHFAQGEPTKEALNLRWPRNVYSLSHVALPFPIEDSLYGPEGVHYVKRIQIGATSTRGERGVLGVSADEILRQKWNPFFPYLISRTDKFIKGLK
ncbi:Alpha/beta hydrolase family [Shewanella psychrophila]|uniref:Alpha/beta hydrolase family n=1 Tax=Shewanella psychrophila TaxID=225848 RepID=A0A1S6HJF5_9GAMM|nr:alpha/beta fold hydrolase [Shewanella psychrophila]AQS35639.1 Alpha/beta hydrolase family [Shewanella psychrophila]